MKTFAALTTVGLLMLSGCQSGVANPQVTPPSVPSSTSKPPTQPARILTITSDTQQPDLPQILIPGLELKVFAGKGKAGYQDGKALESAFDTPLGMAKDEKGNIYVADRKNYRIRKRAPVFHMVCGPVVCCNLFGELWMSEKVFAKPKKDFRCHRV